MAQMSLIKLNFENLRLNFWWVISPNLATLLLRGQSWAWTTDFGISGEVEVIGDIFDNMWIYNPLFVLIIQQADNKHVEHSPDSQKGSFLV